jgi:hypothetical protein
MNPFSPAQCVGYLAFTLGVTAFLQSNDRRLKVFNSSECFVYAVHFLLLGNFPASASSFISGVRSLLSLKTRSPLLAALIIAINLALGAALVKSGFGWLPVAGSCIATVGVFMLQGIALRLSMLTSTFLWLANNIVSGSIGGTSLEVVIAVVNISTILRLVQAKAQRDEAT